MMSPKLFALSPFFRKIQWWFKTCNQTGLQVIIHLFVPTAPISSKYTFSLLFDA